MISEFGPTPSSCPTLIRITPGGSRTVFGSRLRLRGDPRDHPGVSRSTTGSRWRPEDAVVGRASRLTAFPVAHSVRCPCIACVEAQGDVLLYSGDIVAFQTRRRRFRAPTLRRRRLDTRRDLSFGGTIAGALIGHATVRAQLGWLGRSAVPRDLFAFRQGTDRDGRPGAPGRAVGARFGEGARLRSMTAARDGLALHALSPTTRSRGFGPGRRRGGSPPARAIVFAPLGGLGGYLRTKARTEAPTASPLNGRSSGLSSATHGGFFFSSTCAETAEVGAPCAHAPAASQASGRYSR